MKWPREKITCVCIVINTMVTRITSHVIYSIFLIFFHLLAIHYGNLKVKNRPQKQTSFGENIRNNILKDFITFNKIVIMRTSSSMIRLSIFFAIFDLNVFFPLAALSLASSHNWNFLGITFIYYSFYLFSILMLTIKIYN